MSSTSNNSIGEQIKAGVKGIHGVGEAIRGTVMDETDKAFGTPETKNAAIAEKGKLEAKNADQVLGQSHGVASNTAPATSAGVHSTAPGNIGSTGGTVGTGPAGIQETPGVNERF